MEINTKSIIQVEDVTIAYGDFIVMKDINFEVKEGEVFVILGGSGCGKSTLLKNMISLVRPITGKVLIDGRNIVTAEGPAHALDEAAQGPAGDHHVVGLDCRPRRDPEPPDGGPRLVPSELLERRHRAELGSAADQDLAHHHL